MKKYTTEEKKLFYNYYTRVSFELILFIFSMSYVIRGFSLYSKLGTLNPLFISGGILVFIFHILLIIKNKRDKKKLCDIFQKSTNYKEGQHFKISSSNYIIKEIHSPYKILIALINERNPRQISEFLIESDLSFVGLHGVKYFVDRNKLNWEIGFYFSIILCLSVGLFGRVDNLAEIQSLVVFAIFWIMAGSIVLFWNLFQRELEDYAKSFDLSNEENL